jgi:hypothetical protein
VRTGDLAPHSPLEINIPLPEPQQSLVINLVGQKDAIFDGIDHTLCLAPRSRVSRQAQSISDTQSSWEASIFSNTTG